MVQKTLNTLALLWIAWFLLPLILLFIGVSTHSHAAYTVLSDSRFWYALLISVTSSIVVMILAVIFGIPLAYFLAYHELPFKTVIESLLIDIPQTLPPVAEGVIYLVAFGPNSSINLSYTFIAVVIAHLFVAAPFAINATLRKFIEIRESRLDLIARSLGAETKHVLFHVLIPLARRDIARGLTLTWSRAMGEFGGTLIFAGVIAYRTETLPTYANRIVSTDPYLALSATAIMVLFAIITLITIKTLGTRTYEH